MRSLRQKLRQLGKAEDNTDASSRPPAASVPSPGPGNAQDASVPATERDPIPDPTPPSTVASEQTIGVQSGVWNEAYQQLAEEEEFILHAYEETLLIHDPREVPDETASPRQDRFRALVKQGLARTEKSARVKSKIEAVIGPFHQLRSVIGLPVKAEPAAATAWAGITAVLDVSEGFQASYCRLLFIRSSNVLV